MLKAGHNFVFRPVEASSTLQLATAEVSTKIRYQQRNSEKRVKEQQRDEMILPEAPRPSADA